ncbi:MAG: hypothetical protein E7537_03780 [Ruminococcaceae bacterium]|nr:hypothetical protein [Oscillospiraceae bacterium]
MFKLALNAGHGIKTPGKRCMKKLDKNQTREWTLNSRICEKIETKLLKYKEYDLIRLDDPTGKKDISLSKRTNQANKYDADFYLSIHHNAGINGGAGGGIETYVYTRPSYETLEWQQDLYKALIEHTKLKGNRSDGMRKKNLHECRESNMPCVLVECGFMDSKTDVPIILSDEFAEKVATACVEVIVNRAKLKNKTATATKENIVLKWQKAAIKDGFKVSESAQWDKQSEKIAKTAICKKRKEYTNKNLTKLLQKQLGIEADGKFGSITEKTVKKYQKEKGLKTDGIVGLKTWKKILGVK